MTTTGSLTPRLGRRSVAVRVLSIPLLAYALGCGFPGPQDLPPPAVEPRVAHPIEIDATHYRMTEGPYGPETVITSRFIAPSDRSVYVANCNGAIGTGLQRLVGEEWVSAWVVAMNACMSEPIEIPPGGSHVGVIIVRPRGGAVTWPEGAGDRLEPGTYRVVWYGVASSPDPAASYSAQLPLEERVSRPFTLDQATHR